MTLRVPDLGSASYPGFRLQVKILKSLDEIAAMTGDGVNDAPALKQAHLIVQDVVTALDHGAGLVVRVLPVRSFILEHIPPPD